MFSLLIVDDEYFIREGLAKDVDWASIGVEVVGSAQNGLEAIEKIEALHPDIILADIYMGTMSGMEMAERLRDAQNDVKIIFLSGYDDFGYMQKALEVKAFDYLLKPALSTELLSSVARAAEEITRERNLQCKIAALESNLAAGLALAQERFFEEVNGNVLTSEWEERAATLGIPTAKHLYCVAEIEPDDNDSAGGNAAPPSRLLAIREIAAEYTSSLPFRMALLHKTHVVLVLCVQEKNGSAETFDLLLEKIRKLIRGLAKTTCTIGVSRVTDSVLGVAACRSEASTSLSYKVTVGNDCVIHITDLPRTDHTQIFYPKMAEKRLIEALETLHAERITRAATGFMDALVQRGVTPVQIRAALAELISVLTRKFLEWDMDIYENFRAFWMNPDSLLAKHQSVTELCNWLTEILLKASSELDTSRSAGIKGIVAQIQQLINEKYADADLSLSMLADKVYLSSAYLSKLYKKETGETYVEYLTFVRMREAKKLLKSTHLKASEIGMRVGYPNAQYFSVLFKKTCGMSPIEYRESKTLA